MYPSAEQKQASSDNPSYNVHRFSVELKSHGRFLAEIVFPAPSLRDGSIALGTTVLICVMV